MNGIQGLMPQGQPQAQPQMPGQAPMSGQAAMPGMQPGGGGPSPGINPQTPMLEKLDLDHLRMLYTQSIMPNSGVDLQPYAILSAISKKVEQKKAIKAVEDAMAMGQNAQQQSMGSVAEQKLQEADQFQEPVMARHGGEMNGYAGGGIVAFQTGTTDRGLPFAAAPSNSLSEAERARWMSYAPLEEKPAIDQKEVDHILKKAPMARTPAENDLLRAAAQPEPQPQPEPAPVVETSGIAQAPGAAMGVQESGIAQGFDEPPTPSIPITPAKPELPAGLRAAYERRIASAGLSPEQLKLQQEKQAEEMRVRRSILEAAEKRAGAAEKRAEEDYKRDEAGIPQMYGPEFFFKIAGDISTKRGEELGSVGKSVAGFMEARRKAQTAARKDYRAAQDAADRMRAASETIRLATAERDSAIANRNIDQARAAQDKIDQAGLEYEKAKYDREQAAIKAVLDERRVKAEEERAEAAGRTATAAEKRAAAYENRPEPTSDLNRAYQIEFAALRAEGEPDTPATQRKALRLAQENLGRTAAGVSARVRQLTAANKEFTERAMSDQSLRGLRGQDRIDALEKLRKDIEKKYDVAPDAPDPTAPSAAPAARPAAPVTPPAAPVTPIAMPAKESELKDGVVYETRRGPARWNAAKKQFFPVD